MYIIQLDGLFLCPSLTIKPDWVMLFICPKLALNDEGKIHRQYRV